jgi:hypothetical protein
VALTEGTDDERRRHDEYQRQRLDDGTRLRRPEHQPQHRCREQEHLCEALVAADPEPAADGLGERVGRRRRLGGETLVVVRLEPV